jgi:hypothetical protein
MPRCSIISLFVATTNASRNPALERIVSGHHYIQDARHQLTLVDVPRPGHRLSDDRHPVSDMLVHPDILRSWNISEVQLLYYGPSIILRIVTLEPRRFIFFLFTDQLDR